MQFRTENKFLETKSASKDLYLAGAVGSVFLALSALVGLSTLTIGGKLSVCLLNASGYSMLGCGFFGFGLAHGQQPNRVAGALMISLAGIYLLVFLGLGTDSYWARMFSLALLWLGFVAAHGFAAFSWYGLREVQVVSRELFLPSAILFLLLALTGATTILGRILSENLSTLDGLQVLMTIIAMSFMGTIFLRASLEQPERIG